MEFKLQSWILRPGIWTVNDYNLCLFLVFPSLCFILPFLSLPYCRTLKVKGIPSQKQILNILQKLTFPLWESFFDQTRAMLFFAAMCEARVLAYLWHKHPAVSIHSDNLMGWGTGGQRESLSYDPIILLSYYPICYPIILLSYLFSGAR